MKNWASRRKECFILNQIPLEIREKQYTRQFQGDMEVISGEKRQVKLSFSSEQPYQRGFGMEILCHDAEAIDLSKMRDIGTVLFHHGRDPNYGNVPIAHIVEIIHDEGRHRCEALIEFDTDEKSDLIFQKVKSGSIRGVSVGYKILDFEKVPAGKAWGRFSGPCVVATRWLPHEISFTPTPADTSVGVGRSINQTDEREENSMDKDTTSTNPAQGETTEVRAAVPDSPVDMEAIRAEAAEAERQRSAEITAVCTRVGINPTEYITQNRSVQEVKDLVIQHLQKSGGQPPVPAPRVEVVADEEDKFREAARDGQLIRAGIQLANPVDGSRNYQGMSLRTLAAQCLQREGGNSNPYHMDDDELLRAALGLAERSVQAPDSAFVSILNNTMGAVVSDGYATAETTFQQWCAIGSNPNFKPAKRFRLSASGDMVEIKQGGEFETSKVYDEGVDTKVKTFGKTFGFTREAFINDDLGTIVKAIQAQTRSAVRSINKEVYKLLAANKIDGKALFSSANNNLGTAAALSSKSLSELFTLMRKQKGIGADADVLNLSPKFVLVPAALEFAVWQLLHSVSDPSAAHSGVANPIYGKLVPVVDAELDRYSETAFYVAASPQTVDTVEVTYLNGKKEPTLESRTSWKSLGIEYRMFHDWGVTVLDHRGLAKNSGK